jgi:hypothetical protein
MGTNGMGALGTNGAPALGATPTRRCVSDGVRSRLGRGGLRSLLTSRFGAAPIALGRLFPGSAIGLSSFANDLPKS